MGMFTTSGSTQRTENFLTKMQNPNELYRDLETQAQRGVEALQLATPVETGLTAASWGYVIEVQGSKCTIAWTNTNSAGGVNVVVLLQYGHGTGTGGYVPGTDFINPALKSVFTDISDQVWRKVTSA